MVCTGLGAASTVDMEANSVSFMRWSGTGGQNPNNDPKLTGVYDNFEISLAAGQVMRYVQNSGTNAEMNVFAKIQETPI